MIKLINFKNKKGFTLIELIIYMGLFSILTLIMAQLFASVFESKLENDASVSVSTDAKFIMSRFYYDMGRASSISSPAVLGSASATLRIVINSQNFQYSLNNGKLILSNLTSGTVDELNSNEASVSALSFTRYDGGGKDVVSLFFTLDPVDKTKSGNGNKSFTTSAGLR